MEELVLVVTRENCEALIGKNVRLIVSDSKEEESDGKGDTAAKNASVFLALCTLFPWVAVLMVLWDCL